MTAFAEFGLNAHLLSRLEARGYAEATPVQAQAIPPLLEGRDALVQSQTGTGKTLAYLLPLLGRLDLSSSQLQGLVVAPTRELAMQILREVQSLSEGLPLRTTQLIGGANVRHQLDKLKTHPHVVVGTPGRLAELVAQGKVKPHALRFVVLDEVDTLLGASYRNDVVKLLKATPRERQTVFASATMGPEALDVARRWTREAEHVQITGPAALPASLTHLVLASEERHKADTLRRLLHAAQPKAALVFVNEGARLEETLKKLSFKGMQAGALMGPSRKQERGEVLRKFREGQLQVLLASEVAARGLDIPHLTHVINLDLPTDAEHYLHRAGRAGRMGAEGSVVNLVAPAERFALEKQAKALGIKLQEVQLSGGRLMPVTSPA